MRLIILAFFTVFCTGIKAQSDTTLKLSPDTTRLSQPVTLSQPQPVADTLSAYIRMPDSLRHNQFIDTLLKQYAFDPFLFKNPVTAKTHLQMGKERPLRARWVIAVILVLLIYTAVLNRLIGKDIVYVFQAFYAQRSLAKLSREDSLLNSWAFICLFALFGFTMGLYVYQVILYHRMSYSINGFQLFITCSIDVLGIFILKIILLRFIGFIFDIGRLIREYVYVLYLTCFNMAFVFLPVVICLSLFPSKLTPYLLTVSVVLIFIVFAIQYLRSSLSIISNFTFPKIYLFIYLCALEICPVLILVKALNL
ncbi:DUF4271 domain-containing protein [Mucilaginibacter paludis]|uniref:DUF4271 domain-containing protein n=1 Tax=Mucilaginibacter paludis DSM 18603 TaxID=714943 RepID=H1Y4N0_9SPHI|nr:DUF4271 domain-containing protein [Mucilaginibacter paludis]EHQ28074.1 hypothetical protein Mucpa_3983 [Mucilaginibacter paludis DSM 18603]